MEVNKKPEEEDSFFEKMDDPWFVIPTAILIGMWLIVLAHL